MAGALIVDRHVTFDAATLVRGAHAHGIVVMCRLESSPLESSFGFVVAPPRLMRGARASGLPAYTLLDSGAEASCGGVRPDHFGIDLVAALCAPMRRRRCSLGIG